MGYDNKLQELQMDVIDMIGKTISSILLDFPVYISLVTICYMSNLGGGVLGVSFLYLHSLYLLV